MLLKRYPLAAPALPAAVQVVWSDRVWSRDDLLGHKKVPAFACCSGGRIIVRCSGASWPRRKACTEPAACCKQ